MAGLTRERGCLYYVPWIGLICLCLMWGGIGVWIHFTNEAYTDTKDALNVLDVEAANSDSLRPVLIATAVVFLVVCTLLIILTFVRSFVEAAHDATGLSGGGTAFFMVLVVLVALAWGFIVLWLVFVLVADILWASSVYILKKAIDYKVTKYAGLPPATWVPSEGLPCPGQCLDLTYFSFIDSSLETACICDFDTLKTAGALFDDAYESMIAVVVGAFVILVFGGCLLINFCCDYSHTKRERDYINRATQKQFIGVM